MGYKNKLIVHWDLPSNSHDRIYIYKQVCLVFVDARRRMIVSPLCKGSGIDLLVQSGHELRHVPSERQLRSLGCKTTAEYRRNGEDSLRTVSVHADDQSLGQINAQVSSISAAHTHTCLLSFASGDSLVLFSGGLPRSTYANKHSVSCLCENEHNADRTRHVTFDFTTAVIDFFTIDKGSDDGGRCTKLNECSFETNWVCSVRDDPQSLVVLLNEEIVVIDLVTDTWPLYHLPYLNSIHASPVICMTLTCHVHQEFYEKLIAYAATQFEDCSDRVRVDCRWLSDSVRRDFVAMFRNGRSRVASW